MTRLEKFQQIASENGVKASVRLIGETVYANVNGVTFVPRGYASFEAKCKELKDFTAPAPVELTSRLSRIEAAYLK